LHSTLNFRHFTHPKAEKIMPIAKLNIFPIWGLVILVTILFGAARLSR